MELILATYSNLAIIILGYMTLVFALSLFLKRNDIADIAWGLGFLICALYSYLFLGDTFGRSLLVLFLIAMWSFRLSLHILLRNKGKAEDPRYAEWRKDWGKWFIPRTFFQVFILQGSLMLVVVMPAVISILFGGEIGWLDYIGVLVWLLGFLFETVGDYQLSQFIKSPANKGKILQTGLWKYTRHPNYFGEVTMWWGIWIIAISVPFAWLTIIGPITITFLILFVSGIPLLENRKKGDPAFEEYKKKTSIFFPLPSKK
jgi:steroid 5-alpha reductase family enzyme